MIIPNKKYRITEPHDANWATVFRKYIGQEVFITEDIIIYNRGSFGEFYEKRYYIKIDDTEFYENELVLVEDDIYFMLRNLNNNL